MSSPDELTSNRGQLLTEPDNRAPTPVPDPAAQADDGFPAAFAAARGTISPELDLDTDLDKPGAAGDDGDAGHQRAGS
jgi:hypothetical protein